MRVQLILDNMPVAQQNRAVLLRGVHPIDALPMWLLRMTTCYHPMVTTGASVWTRREPQTTNAGWYGSEGY